jgi:hypothetical protein
MPALQGGRNRTGLYMSAPLMRRTEVLAFGVLKRKRAASLPFLPAQRMLGALTGRVAAVGGEGLISLKTASANAQCTPIGR